MCLRLFVSPRDGIHTHINVPCTIYIYICIHTCCCSFACPLHVAMSARVYQMLLRHSLVLFVLICYPLEMDRAAKLRKLNDFRRSLPHCSANALASIVAFVTEHGVPDAGGDRNSYRQARDAQTDAPTPYGPILQRVSLFDKSDNPLDMVVAHPLAILWKAVDDCDAFSTFMLIRLKEKPPSRDDPWNLIIYSDEVTPGNPLATLNKRKFHAVYWTFLEFGVNALSREESWFCVTTEYSLNMNKYSAGLSQAFAAIIMLFFSADGTDLSTTGVLLHFGNESVRLWAKVGGILQDGGAHKSVWHCRGDGSHRFCLLCKNLVTHQSALVDEDGSNLLCSRVIKYKDLVMASSRDIRKSARYIANRRATLAPQAFTDLQTALGLTDHPHAILLWKSLDIILDPIESYVHDPMHALFVDGVCSITLYLLLEVCIVGGMPNIYSIFSEYLAEWHWPARLHGDHLADIFAGDRKDKHRKAQHIKCQASDMLSILPVAALFAVNVIMHLGLGDGARQACDAWISLVDVVELILMAAHGNVPSSALLTAVEKFLEIFAKAFGYDYMTPKFHWLLHFPDILKRMRALLMCFCLERKHRMPKRYATDLTNVTKGSGASLLKEVTSHHFGQLSQPNAFNFAIGLVNGRSPSKAMKVVLARELGVDCESLSVKVSRSMRYSTIALCGTGDMLLFRTSDASVLAGKARCHYEIEGVPVSLVSVYQCSKKDSKSGYSLWTATGYDKLIEASSILDTVIYRKRPDDRLDMLLPAMLR